MSWDVYLEKDGKPVEVDRHEEGGTYAVGGTTVAELNLTYNYSPNFHAALGFPFRMLDGTLAENTIPNLEAAVQKLGTERADDYWKATDGNAGFALNILLGWAKANPNARWRIS